MAEAGLGDEPELPDRIKQTRELSPAAERLATSADVRAFAGQGDASPPMSS